MSVRTCAHGKAFFTSSLILGTCTNRQLRASFIAPFREAFKPLTPWHGGPAPMRINPACENLKANSWTIASSTSAMSFTLIVFGKRDSTTRAARSSFSTPTCPTTFHPRVSAATRTAAIPSKSPTVRTWVISIGSTTSPRMLHWAAMLPAGVTREDAVTPPPDFEASLAVTTFETVQRKSI